MPADALGYPRRVMTDRRYLIRTFGCQMNEHDSERIAGVLVADGMAPAAEAEDAEVIV
ncbi:MAG: tRNA (N6-isopentenyl adenosine(37)-C2)-methylthiotransferase MiaB, partial [Chloroflexota bacterium]